MPLPQEWQLHTHGHFYTIIVTQCCPHSEWIQGCLVDTATLDQPGFSANCNDWQLHLVQQMYAHQACNAKTDVFSLHVLLCPLSVHTLSLCPSLAVVAAACRRNTTAEQCSPPLLRK